MAQKSEMNKSILGQWNSIQNLFWSMVTISIGDDRMKFIAKSSKTKQNEIIDSDSPNDVVRDWVKREYLQPFRFAFLCARDTQFVVWSVFCGSNTSTLVGPISNRVASLLSKNLFVSLTFAACSMYSSILKFMKIYSCRSRWHTSADVWALILIHNNNIGDRHFDNGIS